MAYPPATPRHLVAIVERHLQLAPVRRKFSPREELAAAGAGVGLAIGDDDFAARDSFARPSGYFEPVKWIIVGARMHLRAADHDFAAGVEYHKVGIGADHYRTLARIEPENLRRIGCHQVDHPLERETPLADALRVQHRHERLQIRHSRSDPREAVCRQLL